MLLVCNVKDKVHVCLDHIVADGCIEVRDERQKIVHEHQFNNSNYESVEMKDLKGTFTVKVSYESQTITKRIRI